jgi:hypothetical protein
VPQHLEGPAPEDLQHLVGRQVPTVLPAPLGDLVGSAGLAPGSHERQGKRPGGVRFVERAVQRFVQG